MKSISRKIIFACLTSYVLSTATPLHASWWRPVARVSTATQSSSGLMVNKNIALIASFVAVILGIFSWKLWWENKTAKTELMEERYRLSRNHYELAGIKAEQEAKNRAERLKKLAKFKDAATQTNELEIAIEHGDTEKVFNLTLQGEELSKKQMDESLEIYMERFMNQWVKMRNNHEVVTVRAGNALALARVRTHDPLPPEVERNLCKQHLVSNLQKIEGAVARGIDARGKALFLEMRTTLPYMPVPLVKNIGAYSIAPYVN